VTLADLDHLLYRAPDLDDAIDELESVLGVRPAYGGAHPGRGTRNALLALGGRRYLEVLAPDPEQPPDPERTAAPDEEPRLWTWAVRSDLIETQAEVAAIRGVDLGSVDGMSRDRPDGVHLSWRLTSRRGVADGLVPFLIDWGGSEHPAESAPTGCELISLRAEHPQADDVTRMLAALGIEMPVTTGARPALIAEIQTPKGLVELR
jgi:hypothetical protein